jgi:hypothetical protein
METMNRFANLLEELEVLEDLRRKAEDAYFADEDNIDIEEAFGEAVNAESAAFHRLCDAIVEFTDGRIQSHTALRMVMNKREALKEIASCM